MGVADHVRAVEHNGTNAIRSIPVWIATAERVASNNRIDERGLSFVFYAARASGVGADGHAFQAQGAQRAIGDAAGGERARVPTNGGVADRGLSMICHGAALIRAIPIDRAVLNRRRATQHQCPTGIG